jgi:Fe-S-cluster containining protein
MIPTEEEIKKVFHHLGHIYRDDENCQKCGAACCKENTVMLTFEEASKLPPNVLEITWTKEDNIPCISIIKIKNGKRSAESGRHCAFLKSNKCFIYEKRPKDCKLYRCSPKGIKSMLENKEEYNVWRKEVDKSLEQILEFTAIHRIYQISGSQEKLNELEKIRLKKINEIGKDIPDDVKRKISDFLEKNGASLVKSSSYDSK